MEDIDIENLDFEAYNREIYRKQGKELAHKREINGPINLNAFAKLKKEINEFVKKYNNNSEIYEKNKKINICARLIN